ncbi:XVIPCD domain-containing protein [Dyella silvatica]|uniref:XVIPCD domain-containing protein n=1 Tax=Dyella silvatica TaxID=2992128 RepID=UPI0022519CB7|nr:XVIPCD domain-containing protein [Dyella silvatica]
MTQEVNDAVAQGHLRKIEPLTNPHAGGEYSSTDQSMRLPLTMLNTPPNGSFDTGEPTFVLGHELQHGFNAAAASQASAAFAQELTVVATAPGLDHDYTAPIGNLIAANRRDEAGAEISGWNAVVSAAQQDATTRNAAAPTLGDIYNRNPGRMDDFIDVNRSVFPPTYVLKPNLQVNADHSMDYSAHNLEGMGQNFYDKARPAPGGLGFHGNSDYPNYDGAYAIGAAVTYERHYNPPQQAQPGQAVPVGPEMSLNMAQLRLNPQTVAENGINLGPNTQPMPYADKSTSPPTQRHFDHTATTHTYVPIAVQGQQGVRPVPLLDQASHPDHALYQQTREAVHRLDVHQGHAPDQRSDNLAAALVVAARRDGMHEVNHAVLSDDASRAFAVQGDLNSPFKRMTQVPTEQAVNTSVAQSSQAWQQVMQQKQPELAQAQRQGLDKLSQQANQVPPQAHV